MKLSRRAKRMIVHQERHKAGASINLIPMIDILSVLVSFLLVYSTEVEVLQNTRGIEIPESVAEIKPRETVVVTITQHELLVQGQPVVDVAEIEAQDGNLIAPLKAALERPAVTVGDDTRINVPDREITILGDKLVPYEVLKKVMATCTDANFGKVSLAVLQKERAVSVAQAAVR